MDGLVRYRYSENGTEQSNEDYEVLRIREKKAKTALTALLFVNLAFLSGAVTLVTLLSKQ